MVILAALFFGLITLGFTLLTVVPLIFFFLWIGVYLEPQADQAHLVAGTLTDRTAPSSASGARRAAAADPVRTHRGLAHGL
jgi:hypothetical protein